VRRRNDDIDNLTLSNPYEIICSGLNNIKFVNDAMLHLYLKNKFDNRKENQSDPWKECDTLNSDDEKQVQPSCEHDDYLIKLWQKTITLRKKTEQINNNINPEENQGLKSFAYTSNQK
ncbi:11045_t:CDS:1, partial [Cetraspora pellucida]